MMARVNGATTVSAVESISKGFGRNAYERVRDLKDMVDFRACHSVVMVGSGAFPATLFWLHDHFPHMQYVGLDIDTRCVAMATLLTKATGMNNIHFEVVNGSYYNFRGADFVYIANQVIPKRAVLEQISRRAGPLQVVVREPTRKGELLAEAIRHDLPSEFAIETAGTGSQDFLSYDLSLRLR